MPQIVEVPGQGTVEFPDDLSPDKIESVLQEQFKDQLPPLSESQVRQGLDIPSSMTERAATTQPVPYPGTKLSDELTQPVLRPPTLAERIRASTPAMKILGPPAAAQQYMVGGQAGTQTGLLPLALATPMPFIPGEAAVAKFAPKVAQQIPKLMLGGFGAQYAIGLPESVRAMKRSAELGDIPELRRQIVETGLPGLMLGVGAREALHPAQLPESIRAARAAIESEATDASKEQKTAEVYGDVRAQPGQGAGQVPAQERGPGVQPQAAGVEKQAPLLLTPEDQAHIDAERGNLGDTGIDVTETLPSGQPFARGGISTIDRQNNRILINPTEYSRWLSQIRPDRRGAAVRSLLNEEKIHLSVDDESALAYWNSLSAAEKLINRYRYTGKLRGVPEVDETMHGQEALRFQLQRLARITPREIIESSGATRMTLQSITVLEDAIRGLRNKLGTEASGTQRALLDRMAQNVAAAKIAAGGQPGAFLKESDARPEDYSPDRIQFSVFKFPELPQFKGGVQADLIAKDGRSSISTNPEELRKLGFDVPSTAEILDRLPFGKYTMADWKEPGVQPGMVRVYHGKGAAEGAGQGDVWWSTNPQRAASYGPQVEYVDVPKAVAESGTLAVRNQGIGTTGDLMLDPSWSRNAKPAQVGTRAKVWDLDAQPMAYRKGRKGEKGTPELSLENVPQKTHETQPTGMQQVPTSETAPGAGVLPPVPPGEPAGIPQGPRLSEGELPLSPVPAGGAAERAAPWKAPTAKLVEEAANQHLQQAQAEGKPPSFEDFLGGLQSQFGAGLTRDSAYYAYQDALSQHLMNSKGEDLGKLIDQLGIRGQLQAEHQRSFAKIADAIDVPAAQQAQFHEMAKLFPYRKGRTPKAAKAWFGPEQQKRYTVIGAIMDKLTKEAGPPPEKPWNRKDIGPEDINSVPVITEPARLVSQPGQPEEYAPPQWESKKLITKIPPEVATDPKALGDLITKGASVEASGKGAPPRTVSRNVVTLKGKSGQIVMVSAWRDPRSGPKVVNPSAPTMAGTRVDAGLLESWRPVEVMNLREPVKDFHKVFPDEATYLRHFGDVGIEGTPGLRGGMFTGPNAELGKAAIGTLRGGRGPTAEPQLPPALNPIELPPLPSETSRELTTPGRPPIRTGSALYRSPRPVPPPGGGVIPGPRAIPEPSTPAEIPRVTYEKLAKPTGKILEVGKPSRPGVGFPLREGMAGTAVGRRTPLAFNKLVQDAKVLAQDEYVRTMSALSAAVKRQAVMQEIPGIVEGAKNAANQYALRAGQSIRLTSGEAPANLANLTGKSRRMALKGQKELATQYRKSAVAMIASGATNQHGWYPQPSKLPDFHNLLSSARTKASALTRSANPKDRLLGRKWLAAVEEHQKNLDWAEQHWADPKLRQTVDSIRAELADEIAYENAMGWRIKSRENYVPGRYEGEFFGDNIITWGARRILGKKFANQRTFDNYYKAIESGPFIPASYDAADLVQHRINQGRSMVERQAALNELKVMRDPDSQEPIAKDPVPVYEDQLQTDPLTGQQFMAKTRVKWNTPSPEYELVYTSPRAEPIAVRGGYQRLVGNMLSVSQVPLWPGGQAALMHQSALKHGVMLMLDTFHLGRLAQYTKALVGWKGSNWKGEGGQAALNYRPQELDEAVRQGIISKEAADWAKGPIDITERIPGQPQVIVNGRAVSGFRTRSYPRWHIADLLISKGLNATKVTDALYKDAVQHIPLIGEPLHRAIGPFNHWLFDKFMPGVLIESAVRNLETLNRQNPNVPLPRMVRDVVKDINTFYGNLGKQGFFKNATLRDLSQLVLLAPEWQQGLLMKELQFYSRLGLKGARAAGIDLPYRRGLPAMGTLGSGMARGLLTYFAVTQLLNLFTRRQFTFQNPEEGHKLDAWIPLGKENGFWLSPLSVFAEVLHDVIRFAETKPRWYDAFLQIGANRLGPIGKAGWILAKGESPTGEEYSTSAGVLKGAASQVIPIAGPGPISLSTPARAVAHAVAPGTFSPPPQGALTRQLLATGAGIKVEAGKSALQMMARKAERWAKEKGVRTEMVEIKPTDAPSYSALRNAIRQDDPKTAKRLLAALRQKKTDQEIIKAMRLWSLRPLTGTKKAERQFLSELSDKEMEMYSRAMEQKQEQWVKFVEWFSQQQ